MLRTVFAILASLVSVYALVCVVRIILTWIPRATFHPVTKFLSSICDPYLDLFHGMRWMRIGGLDFSPAIALCLLGAVSTILSHLANSPVLGLGSILSLLVQTAGSIVSSVISLLILLFVVRLIIIFATGGSFYGSSVTYQIDQMLGPVVTAISRTFTGDRQISYKTGLIITIVTLIVLNLIVQIVFSLLAGMLSGLPL